MSASSLAGLGSLMDDWPETPLAGMQEDGEADLDLHQLSTKLLSSHSVTAGEKQLAPHLAFHALHHCKQTHLAGRQMGPAEGALPGPITELGQSRYSVGVTVLSPPDCLRWNQSPGRRPTEVAWVCGRGPDLHRLGNGSSRGGGGPWNSVSACIALKTRQPPCEASSRHL